MHPPAMARRKQTRISASQKALAASTGPASKLSYDTLVNRERPSLSSLNTIIARCRTVTKESTFLKSYYKAKLDFYNAGFKVVRGPASKASEDVLQKWLAEDFKIDAEFTNPSDANQKTTIELNMTKGEAIRRFVKNAWMEFLPLDNTVGMWLDDGRAPTCLPPEKCEYIDKLGIQILYYTHGLNSQDIALLDQDQQERFRANSRLLLSPDEGEHFKVLKRALDGEGFGVPGLYSLFRTIGEVESKEIGFHARAHQLRDSTRHHKVGHEIKQGAHAGKPTHFINKRRSDAVLAQFKDREGPHEFVSNFDHEVVFPWPDLNQFDETAWKGTDKRFCTWGGPLAQMLVSDKIIEGGLSFERAQATADRLDMADFLKPIIKGAFNPPENLEIDFVWSDLVFIDPNKAVELIKFAAQYGLASNFTVQRLIGLNPDEEATMKVREAEDKDAAKKFHPMWDGQHGIAPALGQTVESLKKGASGADPASNNGRPSGSGNNT